MPRPMASAACAPPLSHRLRRLWRGVAHNRQCTAWAEVCCTQHEWLRGHLEQFPSRASALRRNLAQLGLQRRRARRFLLVSHAAALTGAPARQRPEARFAHQGPPPGPFLRRPGGLLPHPVMRCVMSRAKSGVAPTAVVETHNRSGCTARCGERSGVTHAGGAKSGGRQPQVCAETEAWQGYITPRCRHTRRLGGRKPRCSVPAVFHDETGIVLTAGLCRLFPSGVVPCSPLVSCHAWHTRDVAEPLHPSLCCRWTSTQTQKPSKRCPSHQQLRRACVRFKLLRNCCTPSSQETAGSGHSFKMLQRPPEPNQSTIRQRRTDAGQDALGRPSTEARRGVYGL